MWQGLKREKKQARYWECIWMSWFMFGPVKPPALWLQGVQHSASHHKDPRGHATIGALQGVVSLVLAVPVVKHATSLSNAWWRHENNVWRHGAWSWGGVKTTYIDLLVLLLPTPPKVDGGYVFTPVCLSVCLFDWLFVNKISQKVVDVVLWRAWVCDEDEMIRFWWRSESGFKSIPQS